MTDVIIVNIEEPAQKTEIELTTHQPNEKEIVDITEPIVEIVPSVSVEKADVNNVPI